ncbi:MAG: hypothetical protein H6Q28_1647, partial [Bacteroidetes bacterium]|nr:hypothetical protein [Bacteroidota bacterium]
VPMSVAYLPVPLGATLMLLFLWMDLLLRRHGGRAAAADGTHARMVD